ncbi:hypothetical protein [Paucibacter sp. Y2R2-4]|uniref:hypothetical protein n=1 Tax=Paucibacter sp. Y2R2-4 TaxID=2893553 RepID=UPI0021E358C0|nr:hypothetical protein [Paucibacter sp. Y2R2-4]MCV2351370.1 hypothetical protein [Paucibacter sp. Y2R2-4]
MRVSPLIFFALTSTAFAQDEALLSCRRLSEDKARLACYDAIAIGVKFGPTSARPSLSTEIASPVSAPTPLAAIQSDPAIKFGLPTKDASSDLTTLQSAVGAGFDGWLPNQRIRLDNGQVWQVVDGSTVSIRSGARKVTIRRGMLGAFYLEVDGLNTSPRVRRIE